MISIEQKQRVAKACNEYAAANGWVSDKSSGVNQLAQFTKVNVMYVSHIMGTTSPIKTPRVVKTGTSPTAGSNNWRTALG